MSLDYPGKIKPLEDAGLTDEQIAGRLNMDPSRFTMQRFTAAEIASELTGNGKDGAGIVHRVMAGMKQAGAENELVANKLEHLKKQEGTVDLGHPLQRKMMQDFVDAGLITKDDNDAVLGLATMPDAVTAQAVKDARDAYALAQAGQAAQERGNAATNAAVASAESGGGATAQRAALIDAWDNWGG